MSIVLKLRLMLLQNVLFVTNIDRVQFMFFILSESGHRDQDELSNEHYLRDENFLDAAEADVEEPKQLALRILSIMKERSVQLVQSSCDFDENPKLQALANIIRYLLT